MDSTSPSKLLQIVVKRADILRNLRKGVDDKRELEEAVGLSRSALNAALKQLRENHLATKGTEGHNVTDSGDMAVRLYRLLWDPYSAIHPSINMISDNAQIDPVLLFGAEVVKANRSDPDKPLERLQQLITNVDRIKIVSLIGYSRYRLDVFDQVEEEDTIAEFIIEDNCFEKLYVKFPDRMTRLLRAGNCTFYRIQERLPFELAIIDDRLVWLGISDKKGRIDCGLVNDSNGALNWAENIYRQYCDRSEKEYIRGYTSNNEEQLSEV